MTDASQFLRTLEDRLLGAESLQSGQALDELLAPDFREFGTGGRIHLRHDALAHPRQPGAVEFKVEDFEARLLADHVALTTYRITARHPKSGRVSHSLRSSVWRCEDARWQIVFHQATRIDPPPS